jgi:hypothetical protein
MLDDILLLFEKIQCIIWARFYRIAYYFCKETKIPLLNIHSKVM